MYDMDLFVKDSFQIDIYFPPGLRRMQAHS